MDKEVEDFFAQIFAEYIGKTSITQDDEDDAWAALMQTQRNALDCE